jgi:hypothetical protein
MLKYPLDKLKRLREQAQKKREEEELKHKED